MEDKDVVTEQVESGKEMFDRNKYYSLGFNSGRNGVVKSSMTIMLLVAKLAKLMMVMCGVEKGSKNPFFNSMYADLNAVREVILQAMRDSGTLLLIQQFPTTDYNRGQLKECVIKDKNKDIIKIYPATVPLLSVITRITDPESGEWQEYELSCYPAEDTPQAIGSAITYLRRYSLMPIFNIAPTDDDGNAASGKEPETRPEHRPAPRHAETRQPARSAAPAQAETPRAMSNDERSRVGLIDSNQFDTLKKMLKANKVNPNAWKIWLKMVYQVDSLAMILSKDFKAICAMVEGSPAIINAVDERQPGEDDEPLPEPGPEAR
jgi:hypothetical protein